MSTAVLTLRAHGPLVLGDLLPATRVRGTFAIGVPWLKAATDLSSAHAVHYGFAVFIVRGIVKAVVAGVATPSAWRLAQRIEGRG